MKAIVLTFDKQIGFAELAIKRYQRLWPGAPFEYLVPFQSAALVPASLKSSPSVRMIETRPDIRSTMQALLDAAVDEAWIFWLIDDRYPIKVLDHARLDRVHRGLLAGEAGDAAGVRLIRWRETLTGRSRMVGAEQFGFQAAGEFNGFWLHQFLRPRVLRQVFFAPSLPDIYGIRDVQNVWVGQGAFEESARMLVPSASLVHFAEPCKKGRLLSGARRDLEAEGCVVPGYETIEAANIYDERTR